MFYSFDRERIDDHTIVYKISSKLDYIPELGVIQLTYIGNQTIVTLQDPGWPSRVDEFLFDQHFSSTTQKSPLMAPTKLTLVKSESKETLEINSIARTYQMKAWTDFLKRFIDSLPITSKKETGPSPLNKERFEIYDQLKKEHPEWTQVKVAEEAYNVNGEDHNEDSVRNAYRDVGIQWHRGDRTR